MELPIRPEVIADSDIQEIYDEYILRINAFLKNNIRYSENGPYCTILLTDISSYISSLEKSLTNKIIKEIKPVYEKVGWIIDDDVQPSGSRYLIFSSNIWKKADEG